MGTRRDGRDRSESILDAALACFAKRGVVGTGIEDIRKKAKASPSSIYHLFGGGMEAILLALLERTFERLFGHLAAEVTATKTAKACVTAIVRAHLAWVLENRDEARVMYQAMSLELSPRVAKPLAKRKAALLAPVVAHVATMDALPRWSPLALDVVILGTTHEACRRLLGGAALDEGWLRDTLPVLAWSALQAPDVRRG